MVRVPGGTPLARALGVAAPAYALLASGELTELCGAVGEAKPFSQVRRSGTGVVRLFAATRGRRSGAGGGPRSFIAKYSVNLRRDQSFAVT